jgi:hypothetical protein
MKRPARGRYGLADGSSFGFRRCWLARRVYCRRCCSIPCWSPGEATAGANLGARRPRSHRPGLDGLGQVRSHLTAPIFLYGRG